MNLRKLTMWKSLRSPFAVALVACCQYLMEKMRIRNGNVIQKMLPTLIYVSRYYNFDGSVSCSMRMENSEIFNLNCECWINTASFCIEYLYLFICLHHTSTSDHICLCQLHACSAQSGSCEVGKNSIWCKTPIGFILIVMCRSGALLLCTFSNYFWQHRELSGCFE